jgi:5'-nucleotidase
MRLLITNDDSIDSLFLHELVFALRKAGHTLFVAAPKTEQSWIGAAKSRHRAVHASPADRGFDCPTWVIDGTPSDCVNIALAHLLPEKPDGVISGINIGFNASLGFILASGTIAGAWEGAVHGLPGVALSQDLSLEAFESVRGARGRVEGDTLATLRQTAARAAEIGPQLIASTPLRSFTVHNLNFPYSYRHDTAVRRTVPARVVIPGLFSPAADDGTHRFIFKAGEDISAAEPLSDRAALRDGHISHTVLDYRVLGSFA